MMTKNVNKKQISMLKDLASQSLDSLFGVVYTNDTVAMRKNLSHDII